MSKLIAPGLSHGRLLNSPFVMVHKLLINRTTKSNLYFSTGFIYKKSRKSAGKFSQNSEKDHFGLHIIPIYIQGFRCLSAH